MSSRLGPRLFCALALASVACAQDEGPAAPGGRNGILLSYITPRLQVVSAEAPARVELALEVRRANPAEASVPYAGARLRVVRAKGRGTLAGSSITTDQDGIARFEVTMPATTDRTAVVVSLERDSDSFLPFDVVSAPVMPLDLAPGDITHLDPPRDGVILRVAGEEARYILIPHQTDLERGGTTYRFFHQLPVVGAGQAAFGTEALSEPYGTAPLGDDPEHDVVSGGIDPGPLTPAAAVPSRISVKSCRISAGRSAPLRYLGRHIAIYVDDDPDKHQARIDSLGAAFDDSIEPTNTRVFGPTTDLDGNGVVLAIFSPDLGGGFGGAYCDSVRLLHVEAFYVRWSPDQPIEAMLAIMAHEHQHVVNAGHRWRTMSEALWLNEAMSLAAETANSMWFTVLPRAWRFLNGQNGGRTMLPLEYDRAFDDGYMMFLVYLGDRFGADFFLRLGTNRRQGIHNIEWVTGLPFETLLRDWFVALAVSGREAFDDPLLAYRTLSLEGMEDEIAACRCVPLTRLEGMRLEPLYLGEGFDAFRSLDRADADYYELIVREGLEDGSRDVYYEAYGRQALKLSVARIR